jgi:hypothetical protein
VRFLRGLAQHAAELFDIACERARERRARAAMRAAVERYGDFDLRAAEAARRNEGERLLEEERVRRGGSRP